MGKRDSSARSQEEVEEAPARQRLDLWLWFARIVRTRPLAAALAESGHVRINGARARAAGKFLKTGDVLTIALERDSRVLRVVRLAERRGAYAQARLLYEDLSAPTTETATTPGES